MAARAKASAALAALRLAKQHLGELDLEAGPRARGLGGGEVLISVGRMECSH